LVAKIAQNAAIIIKNAPIITTAVPKVLQNLPIITTLGPKLAQNVLIAIPIATKASVDGAPQFNFDISSYVEGITEAPYITNKKLRVTYEDAVWHYYRQYGIYNCSYAFCENLEVL
jgi:hypothetical protein